MTGQHSKQHGLTLIELMVTVAVLGILAAWGYPAFTGLVSQMQYNRTRDALVDTLSAARNDAIFNSRTVRVCASLNGSSCDPTPTDWDTGWIVHEDCNGDAIRDTTNVCDRDRDGTVDTANAAERIIRTYGPPDHPVTATAGAVTFFPTGQDAPGTTCTITTAQGNGTVEVNAAATIFSKGIQAAPATP